MRDLKKIKKALLIVPPTGLYIREDRCQTPIERLATVAPRPPIDLLYIAAVLEQAGVECQVRDYPMIKGDWGSLEQDLRNFHPDILILSITTPSIENDLIAAEIAKKIDPEIITIAKGAHFNYLDKATLSQFPSLDIVTRGEYELTFKDIVTQSDLTQVLGITYSVNGKIYRNPDRPFLENLDELPFPARHLIDNKMYVRPDTGEPQTTLIAHRGCPFQCIFCLSTQVAGTRLRLRSPENIIKEIQQCISSFGIKNYLFRADTFTLNKNWTMELCQKIKQAKLDIAWSTSTRVDAVDEQLLKEMKSAGCWLLAFGIETGDNSILELIGKKNSLEEARQAIKLCKKVGIKTSLYFLLGLPWESEKTFNTTVSFAKELNPDFVEFFYVYPFPGTKLYQYVVDHGLLKPGEIPKTAYDGPAFPSFYLSLSELAKLRERALLSFYFRPGYLIRTLKNAGSFKQMFNYIRYGIKQLVKSKINIFS